MPSCPLDLLTDFFTPLGLTDEASNSPDECGYYFIPYDFVDAVHAAGGLWAIDVMDVEFTKQSYTKNMASGFVKDSMIAATLESKWTEFESFTPWIPNDENHPRFK